MLVDQFPQSLHLKAFAGSNSHETKATFHAVLQFVHWHWMPGIVSGRGLELADETEATEAETVVFGVRIQKGFRKGSTFIQHRQHGGTLRHRWFTLHDIPQHQPMVSELNSVVSAFGSWQSLSELVR